MSIEDQIPSEVTATRRGTLDEWETLNPVLDEAEFGLVLDTGKFKIGDGTTSWHALPYFVSEESLNLGTASLLDAPTNRTATINQVVTGNDARLTPRVVLQNPFSSPKYLSAPGPRSAYAGMTNEYIGFTAIFLPAGRIDRIGADVAVAGVAGTTVALGLYSDGSVDGTPTYPANLLYNFGNINGASATSQEITVDFEIEEGWYWLALLVTVGSASIRYITPPQTAQSLNTGLNNAVRAATPLAAFCYNAQIGGGPVFSELPLTADFTPEGTYTYKIFASTSTGPSMTARYAEFF